MDAAVTAQERASVLDMPGYRGHRHADADEALADLDTYSDWFTSHCIGHTEVSSHGIHHQVRGRRVPFDEGEYQLLLDKATVPQLQHIMLETCFERRGYLAMQEIKRRYLAWCGVAA